MLQNPPTDAVLALVHAVDAGTAYLHCALAPDQLQAVNAVVIGNLTLPLGFLTAEGLCSPYLQLFCLAGEGTGSAAIKSRRNLARAGQAAQM